jgi:hypothetical protein
VVGHERLLEAQWKQDNSLGWFLSWKPANGCKDISQCQRWRESLLKSILLSPKVYTFIVAADVRKGFCILCAHMVGKAVAAGRAKMWEDLPSFFNLPPWSELKNYEL